MVQKIAIDGIGRLLCRIHSLLTGHFPDGLLSTDRTLFPSYTAGLYEENGSVLFATRGLGNSGPTFRLFNRPEVAIVTLHKS